MDTKDSSFSSTLSFESYGIKRDDNLIEDTERIKNRLNSSIFECSICFDSYDDTVIDMAPRILCCGHTLCQESLI